MERNAGIPTSPSRRGIVISTLLLLFVAIALNGGEYVWQQAAVCAAIFLLAGFVVATRSDALFGRTPRSLLLPLLILSAYSILQGSISLLSPGTADSESILPRGLDGVASIWSGVKVLAFLCTTGLCLTSLRSSRKTFVDGVIAIGCAFAVLGIVRLAVQGSVPEINRYFFAYDLRPGVGFGTFLNQNHFAMLMLMTLGLSIGRSITTELHFLRRVGFLTVGLVSWIAIVLTASRGGIIGSFFVVGTLMIFRIGSTALNSRNTDTPRSSAYLSLGRSVAASAVIIGALVAGVVFVGQGRVMQRFAELPEQVEGTDGSAFRRADLWEATAKMIEEHFAFGVGFGGFQYGVAKYIDISGDVVPKQVHNDYLELFASGGVVAAFSLIWFLYGLGAETARGLRSSRDRSFSGARIGAVCGIVGVAFHSFADFGLQYLGNSTFLAALVAIAIFRPDATPDVQPSDIPRSGRRLNHLLAVIVAIVLFIVSATFAYSRYSFAAPLQAGKFDRAFGIPFDAEFFAVQADQLVKRGDVETAVDSLRKAVRLRDHDYMLWLKLGNLLAALDRSVEASDAYRAAIDRAPRYGEPRFYYGAFLLRSGATDQAVNELVFAARRDDRFTVPVLDMIWDRTPLLSDQLIELARTDRSRTKASIVRAALARREFDLIAAVSCHVDLSEIERDMLVRQLLELRQYHTAWKVHRSLCQSEDLTPSLIDGGFEESTLKKGFGFGWIVDGSVTKSNIALDRENRSEGSQSIRFTFDGNAGPVLLEQMIPVARNTRYHVNFSYKTAGIVSGGIPVVRAVGYGAETSVLLEEVELASEDGWHREALSFLTDDRTEAIKITLTRRSCGSGPCPIFGKLWVDGFQLTK